MVFVGVLPYSYDEDNNIVILLGKEAYVDGWQDSLQWSGFGGSLEETDNSIYDGMAREAYEESMGFLGTQEEIYNKILNKPLFITNKNKEFSLKINYGGQPTKSYTTLLYIPYNNYLPDLYIRTYDYLRSSTLLKDNFPLAFSFVGKKKGFFEKIEINWFYPNEITENNEIYQFRKAFLDNWNQTNYFLDI